MMSIVEEEVEEEVFFETVESLSETTETDRESENFVYKESEYDVWINEPQSVQERRERFIQNLGLSVTSSNTNGIVKCGMEYGKGDEDEDGSSSDAPDSGCGYENRLFSSEMEMGDERISGSESSESDQFYLASASSSERVTEPLAFLLESECKELNDRPKEHDRRDKKRRNWMDFLLSKSAKKESEVKPSQMKVSPEHKKCVEFSAVYVGQKIKVHSGCIRVMRISPDGHYLASGGDDGVIRIWLITSADGEDLNPTKLNGLTKSPSSRVVIPDRLFHIEECPLYEFYGHSGCILDLTWSKSNHLVSSSEDGMARLWKIGRDECLNVFRHSHAVTCVQFNPLDDNYFISGSIDGKVRIWGTFKGRVTDWIDIRDAITAISYQPDATGFVVGSSTGTCRFYGYSGDDLHLQLEAQVRIHGKKKTSSTITSIQFSPDEIKRIMITSNDSAVRILDGVNLVHKYKGLRKSSSQLSASFTATGQHIISLDTDSRIYVWNYDSTPSPSYKKSSTNSCEHFLFKDVSVAIPWSPIQTIPSPSRDSDSNPLETWLTSDNLIPSSDWDVPLTHSPPINRHHSFPCDKRSTLSGTWGLVIVTASRDGVIRTFHNYGLPTGVGSSLRFRRLLTA